MRQKIVIKLSGSIFNFKTQSATLKKYAALLIALTDKVQPIIVTGGGKIETLDEVAIAVEFNKIVVAGGLHPGQSTNATSALISEKIGADTFINATDVPGIYDKDPSVNSDARMFSELSVDKCMELLRQKNSQAGTYELMDLVALKVIHRSKIQTIITKADIDTLKDIILNGSNIGTRITF